MGAVAFTRQEVHVDDGGGGGGGGGVPPEHLPEEHVWVAPHSLPQVPQLLTS